MKRTAGAVAVLVLLGACPRLHPEPSVDTGTTGDLARADELARTGSGRAARTLYRKVLRGTRGTPTAAEALYGLGRLYVDPESGVRDYAAAQVAFGRLMREYPDSMRAAEARAWEAALGELLRSQADARRMRADLERLKALDLEQERPR
jgi:hypothetical protein